MQNTNKLTVLILAAGYGRRTGPFSRMVNKALIPYQNKPLISHIFNRFKGARFVIAVGHLGNQVKDYVSLIHAEKDITFVDINDYNEKTTGPATTIVQCEEYLPDQFMWITCDTLFEFNYKDKLTNSWIGVSPIDAADAQDYSWVEVGDENIIKNKQSSLLDVNAFIGLMYVHDKKFINKLKDCKAKDVYQGFIDVEIHKVDHWQDFGTYEKWKEHNEVDGMNFSKPNEIFYDDNNKIIKFTSTPGQAQLKYERAKLNQECMPNNIVCANNFLIYDKEEGEPFYSNLEPDLFSEFLYWAESNLWLPKTKPVNSIELSLKFYKDKTYERLAQFRMKYPEWEESSSINGCSVDTIDEYLERIDFTWLAKETSWAFIHGDLQFDNVIYNTEDDKFTIIDWRTDFAGSLHGDLYYDLAKMFGGLCLNYRSVKDNSISYNEEDGEVNIEIPSVEDVAEYVRIFKEWCDDRDYDFKKIQTLIPIIYLNMAPLHEEPFDKYLIALSQLFFSQL